MGRYPMAWVQCEDPPGQSAALERRKSLVTIEIKSVDPGSMSFPDRWWEETIERDGFRWYLRDASKREARYQRGRRV